MNLEIISIVVLVSLLINLYLSFYLKNKDKDQKSDFKSKVIKTSSNNTHYEEILKNLPCYLFFSSDDKLLYTNIQEDTNLFSQIVTLTKKFHLENKIKSSKHSSKIHNIILDGKATPFKIEEFNLKKQENNDEKILFVIRNIEDEENLKRELNSYVRMYRDLLDASSYGIAFYSKERRLVFYNDVFLKLWSLDSRWLDCKPLFDEVLNHLIEKNFISQIDIGQYRKDQIKMFSNLIEVYNDFIYLPDNRIIRVLIIPNNSGGLLFSYEDVTNKLIVERSYNHLMKVYRAVLENINEAVAIFSPNCKLYLYNFSYLKIFNLDRRYLDTKPHFLDIMNSIKKNNELIFENDTINEIIKLFNDYNNLVNRKFNFSIENQKILLHIIPIPENLFLFLFRII